jgi:hypothetical protein
MSIVISLASRDDLPALAEVNRSGYSSELPSRFAHKNWTDTSFMLNFFKGRLAARFDHRGTQVFKASDANTGEIVGLACWTREDATSDADQTPTGAVIQQMPPHVNVDFIKAVGAEVEQLRDLMKGEDHYCELGFQLRASSTGA